MKISDLKDLEKDDVLKLLGLQTRSTTSGYVVSALAPFGIGLLVGAAAALLLAPKAGSELRDDLRSKLRRANGSIRDELSEEVGISP